MIFGEEATVATRSLDTSRRDWAQPGQPIQGAKIVIVDDEVALCTVVAAILEDGGYRTVVATNPLEAVDVVRREQPNLVLVDIAMPEMDGHAVATALQADAETRSCAIVFLTGRLGFSERMNAFRGGARDYVTKPFVPEKLLAKVAKVLQERAAAEK